MQSPDSEASKCEHVAGGTYECAPVSKPKQNVAALDLNQAILPLGLVERQLIAPGDDDDADLKCWERRLLQQAYAISLASLVMGRLVRWQN